MYNQVNMMSLSFKDQTFINVATEEALKSEVLMRIGCVAVMNGKIISKAHNSYRNRTYDGFVADNQCTCHAEMAALRGVFRSYCGNTYGKWMEALKVANRPKAI